MIASILICVFSFVLLIISDRDSSVLEPLEALSYSTLLYGSVMLLIDIFGGEEDE
jgi:hypothetical protein